MLILGIIPARGGSKGIPDKNILPLCGKPLIQYAHEAAVQSKVLDRVILSTDSESIAQAGKSLGIEVPFVRPAEFSADVSPMINVVIHALDELARTGYVPDAVLLLQPTSPLRKPGHIRTAVELLGENDSVVSVFAVPQEYSPYYLMKILDNGWLDFFMPEGRKITRRQDAPIVYKRDGTIFLTKTRVLREQRSFYGNRCKPMIMAAEEHLNIDNWDEWNKAEKILGDAH